MKENKTIVEAAYTAAFQYMNYLIMATPTGKVRELLTEANLQLMQAEREWKHEKAGNTEGVSSSPVKPWDIDRGSDRRG